jgi:glucose-6-phosphate 1-dehydrogenase
MVPNHVSATGGDGQELPISFDADAVRAKKTEVVRHQAARSCPRFQGCGAASTTPARCWANGFGAYRQSPMLRRIRQPRRILPGLNIDNWRWAGVLFYLCTGKYMKRRSTEIAIRYR